MTEHVRQPIDPDKCKPPAHRLHAWVAYDGTFCVACNDCGLTLRGARDEVEAEEENDD